MLKEKHYNRKFNWSSIQKNYSFIPVDPNFSYKIFVSLFLNLKYFNYLKFWKGQFLLLFKKTSTKYSTLETFVSLSEKKGYYFFIVNIIKMMHRVTLNIYSINTVPTVKIILDISWNFFYYSLIFLMSTFYFSVSFLFVNASNLYTNYYGYLSLDILLNVFNTDLYESINKSIWINIRISPPF